MPSPLPSCHPAILLTTMQHRLVFETHFRYERQIELKFTDQWRQTLSAQPPAAITPNSSAIHTAIAGVFRHPRLANNSRADSCNEMHMHGAEEAFH